MIEPAEKRTRDVLARGERGDFSSHDELIAWHSRPGAKSPWRFALRAQRWLATPTVDEPTPVEELARCTDLDAEQRVAASIACDFEAFRAMLAFDGARHAQLRDVQRALVERLPASRESVRAEIGRLWTSLAAGELASLDLAAEDCTRTARDVATTAELIEIDSVRALIALVAGDVERATRMAREASRTARAHELPQSEYLAHLVLARVRRHAGTPHLAARILASLACVAPPCWRPWLSWEAVAAGAGDGGATGPAAELRALVDAASAGERDRFDGLHASLASAVSRWTPLSRELSSMVGAIDPRAPVGRGEMARWAAGITNVAPDGALCVCPGGSGRDSAMVWVAARPGGPARRVLRCGLALADTDHVVLPQSPRRQGRLDMGLATLLLAGDAGIDVPEFFRSVYGFRHAPRKHDGVLKVLVHRMRDRLGDLGAIEYGGGTVRARAVSPLIVADPRCILPIGDHLLRWLAAEGGGTARAGADSLGLPVRTVQTGLAELAASGACVSEKRGRSLEYRVEDTTFSPPTGALVAPAP